MSSGMPGAAPAVYFLTLGCAKNEVDSDQMRWACQAAGLRTAKSAEEADAVVVNTCSFIEAATEESLEAIFDLAGMRESGWHGVLVVAGCMPARYGGELEEELDEADAFVPCSRKDDIAGVIWEALGREGDRADTGPPAGLPGQGQGVFGAGKTPPSAYVKISEGCDRFCSFCTIPFIRGRYASFSPEAIHAEVARLVAGGTREIVLIAQDTGRWGTDFAVPSSLPDLLDNLASAFPSTWLRVMYIQPEGITEGLLDTVARHPNICSYLDMPLQHVEGHILRAMNREGSRAEFEALIARIRARVEGVTLRTTLIAGFPGETADDFASLCSFVEEAGLDYVGVFPYSREEGTRAAKMAGQIDEETKAARANELRALADSLGTARVARRIGEVLDVLVLGREEDGQLFGRAMCQAPEVDGVVYLGEGVPGEVRQVAITGTLLYEMEGE